MTKSLKSARTALVGAAALFASASAGAAVIDLTGGYNICAMTDGAYVCSGNTDGSTGSGTFPEFVGSPGGRPDSFFMYNTTTNPREAGNEVGNGTNQNRDVTLGDFAVTSFMGLDVFTFVLDINQLRADPLLSLNHVSIFMGDGSLTGYDPVNDTLGGVAPTWAMPIEDTIELNYSLVGGSGDGADMFLYVPVSFFAGFGTDAHLQMYSLFGMPNNNNNGFEEWSYLSCSRTDGAVCYTPPPPPPVEAPEPGSLALLSLGLLGFGMSRRRSKG